MTDLSRDIGGLEARMDEHEKRFDRLDQKIDDGFKTINNRLDTLTASENWRKGAVGILKILGSGGILTGLYEGVKALFGK